ncbi:hypothetical protein [Formosa haliotis]|uniref:hypothetical protein n=1 Tax=Formosa haliotis TaxID=1555194 RepID=UPI000824677D|nr:hypothetical protein [Formosa haliotis]
MRIGMNPEKQEGKIRLNYQHRVIIVVYIPSLEGYYKEVFEVFKLCLASVTTTKNNKCAITIVNNGCCETVVNYINDQLKKDDVDSVIHHKQNIGKMDALIGAARGSREPLITLSDVDILYKTGWQEAVETIFYGMNQVGSVSPIPVRNSLYYGASSTLKRIILNKVKYSPQAIPENFDSYNRFLESVGWEKETDKNLLWPVIESNNIKSVLGSMHQVMTLNREIIMNVVPKEPSFILVGNDSELNYCDLPIDYSGGMRLSTYNNYAFHMGNTVEPWMQLIQETNVLENKNVEYESKIKRIKFKVTTPNLFFDFKRRVFQKVFKCFINKGRVKEEIHD